MILNSHPIVNISNYEVKIEHYVLDTKLDTWYVLFLFLKTILWDM